MHQLSCALDLPDQPKHPQQCVVGQRAITVQTKHNITKHNATVDITQAGTLLARRYRQLCCSHSALFLHAITAYFGSLLANNRRDNCQLKLIVQTRGTTGGSVTRQGFTAAVVGVAVCAIHLLRD